MNIVSNKSQSQIAVIYKDEIFFTDGYFIDDSLSCISISNIVFMSFHRYFQLKFALKTNEQMTKKNLIVIFLAWILISLFWLSVLIVDLASDMGDCSTNFKFVYIILGQIIFYFIPLIFITMLNILTIVEINKRNKIKHLSGLDHPGHSSSSNNRHGINKFRHYKPYLCLFGISSTMVFSFILYVVIYPVEMYCSDYVDQNLSDLTVSLTFLIIVMDPIIILVFQESFKTEFIRILNKFKRCFRTE